MRTWDLFDTLLTRRCVEPFTDEHDPQMAREASEFIPITENIAQVLPDDIIVSDMYLPLEFLHEQCQRVTGLTNEIIVGNNIKGSGQVWAQLRARGIVPTHHHDDAAYCLAAAKAAGVEPVKATAATPTPVEAELRHDFPALAKWMRETRLRTYNAHYRPQQLLQSQDNIPLLFLASLLLHRRATQLGIQRLLMTRRDCCLWEQLQERVKRLAGGTYEVVPFYASRAALDGCSQGFVDYVNRLLDVKAMFVDLHGRGVSVPELLTRIGKSGIPWYLLARCSNAPLPENVVLANGTDALERANASLERKTIDVSSDGLPVHEPLKGIDWATIVETQSAHEVFDHAMEAFEHHDFVADLAQGDEIVLTSLRRAHARIEASDALARLHDIWRIDDWHDPAPRNRWKSPCESVDRHTCDLNITKDMVDYLPYLQTVAKGNVLEIGTNTGASTAAFLLGVEDMGGHVYSVDINPGCARNFTHPQWTFIHKDCRDGDGVRSLLPSQLDVLLVDGDHSYGMCSSDLLNYASLVKPGGKILVHDVTELPEVRRAFDDFATALGWKTKTHAGRYGLGEIVVPTVSPVRWNSPQTNFDHYRNDPNQDMYDYAPMLREVARGNILEIGVRGGVSTAAFLLGVEKNGGHVYSLDMSPDCGNNFRHPQWSFIQAHSRDFAKVRSMLPERLDLLLIDGDHTLEGCLSDLELYAPLVRPGGIILVHDVAPTMTITPTMIANGWVDLSGVREAFDKFVLQRRVSSSILPGRFGMGKIIVPLSATDEACLVGIPPGVIDIKIAGHFACYKNKRATFEALRSFREHFPDAPVNLCSDNGDDFADLALHFDCAYNHYIEPSGNGITTAFDTHAQAMKWFRRLESTCKLFPETDWIVLLEDDVRTQGRIKWLPSAPMAGPCTMPFSSAAQYAIKLRHPELVIHNYSGCGGTIFHREAFLKCMTNFYDIGQVALLDGRLERHSDAMLTYLFLWNGFENSPWLDHSERSRNVGRPDAAFDHQCKAFYDQPWEPTLLES
jgi:predicted O-methyltransferase YrrM